MKFILRKLLIIMVISSISACSKESICETYPCNKSTLTGRNFNDIKYRKGVWVDVTNIDERTNTLDTVVFESDSIWSYWGFDQKNKTTSGFYHKKYELHQPFANSGNTGSIRNFANFLNQTTSDFRTYDWYFDTAKGFVYIDFNRDFRSITEPVIYSRFIKIE